MENHEQVRFVQTNPRIPSSLGTLNVIFGAILLLYALGSVAWTIGAPIVTAHIFGQTEAARLREKTERKASLADLKKQESAETSVAKKAELKHEIAALETAINLEFGDDEAESEQSDLRLTVPYWVDTILGLLLSVLMIVSGAWLMSLRERGRTLALWVAGIKLAWLVVNFGYALTVSIPLSLEIMSADIVREEAKARQPMGTVMGQRPVEFAKWAAVSAAAVLVATSLVSAIYPAITVWLLNKKTVKAAFEVARPREKSRASFPGAPGTT